MEIVFKNTVIERPRVIALENKLGLYGVGDTEEEARRDLMEHFDYYFNYYAMTEDSDLTECGLKLKNRYIEEGIKMGEK